MSILTTVLMRKALEGIHVMCVPYLDVCSGSVLFLAPSWVVEIQLYHHVMKLFIHYLLSYPQSATVSQYGQCIGCRFPQPCPSCSWRKSRCSRAGVGPSRVHYAPSVFCPCNIWIWPGKSRFRFLAPKPRHI